VSTTVRLKDNERTRQPKKKVRIRPSRIRRMAQVAVHRSSALFLPPGGGMITYTRKLCNRLAASPGSIFQAAEPTILVFTFSPIFIWAVPNVYPGFF
jgi:hypothetical protein